MLTAALEKIVRGHHLSAEEMTTALDLMLTTDNPYQSGAFLALMSAKGATLEELLGVVKVLRKEMISLTLPFPVLDIVGTGGDKSHTVNISTGAAILAASCGIKIAKHGTRSVSSRCGSADLVEELGVSIEISPEQAKECLEKVGIAFLFASHFHPAYAKISPVRRGLKIPTLFNILGPLLNPARAEYQMIGVGRKALLQQIPQLLYRLGTKRSFVFFGEGLDELSCRGPAEVYEVTPHGITPFILDPKNYGLHRCSLQDLQGGDKALNASLLLDALEGKEGAIGDTLAFNCAVALYLMGKTETIREGISIAKQAIQDKKPLELISKWRKLCPIS